MQVEIAGQGVIPTQVDKEKVISTTSHSAQVSPQQTRKKVHIPKLSSRSNKSGGERTVKKGKFNADLDYMIPDQQRRQVDKTSEDNMRQTNSTMMFKIDQQSMVTQSRKPSFDAAAIETPNKNLNDINGILTTKALKPIE